MMRTGTWHWLTRNARMSRQLAEIDAALERLYRTPERFGICEDTGDDIPLERLEMIPWARTCDQAGARPAAGGRPRGDLMGDARS